MLFINIAGVVLILLIAWWFWLYRPPRVAADVDNLTIVVDNGVYQPSHIKLPADTPATLYFVRKDASPCAETVQFPDLDISEILRVNRREAVNLPPLKAGEYHFHCQMQMYRGQLTVE